MVSVSTIWRGVMLTEIQNKLQSLGYEEAARSENVGEMCRGKDYEEVLAGLDIPAEMVYQGWVKAALKSALNSSINPKLLMEVPN
jgi:hypothetical protein